MSDTQVQLDEKLLEAAISGSIPDLVAWLEAGASVNGPNGQGMPLIMAAWKGYFEVVKILLAAGADTTCKDSDGTALDNARKRGHQAVADLLRNPPPPVTNNPDEIIFYRKVSNRTLEEIFNFATRERISLIRKEPYGPVEAMTCAGFSAIEDDTLLRKAFEEHVKRGGKTDESLIFPRQLPKPVLSRKDI